MSLKNQSQSINTRAQRSTRLLADYPFLRPLQGPFLVFKGVESSTKCNTGLLN